MNDENSDGKLEDIYLTTGIESVKANNIKHNSRVSLSVADQIPPFSFVVVEGEGKIFPYKQKEVLKWATKITRGAWERRKTSKYGRINSGEGAGTSKDKA